MNNIDRSRLTRGGARKKPAEFWSDVEIKWPKRLCAWLFGWTLIVTYDYNGEMRLRRLYLRREGNELTCRSHGFDGFIPINNDGTVVNSNVVRWELYKGSK